MSPEESHWLAAAFGGAEAGLAILGPDARLVLWNDWLADRSGIPFDRARGRRLDELFPELVSSRLIRMVRFALERGMAGVLRPAFGRSPLPLTTDSATSLGFDRIQHAVVVKPLSGSPRHCLIQVSDVSSMVRRESMLRDQAKNLARSNAELQELAYVVSHDLRAPLRTVRQFSEFVREDAGPSLDEKARSHLDHVVGGVERMDRLIVDLLEYSRVGSAERIREPINLDELISEVLGNLQASIEVEGGRVEVGELPRVQGDATRLMQLFQNLIGNALKFRGEEAPVVQVSCQEQGERWEFRVTDNGIGIDPRHQDRIFGVFKRLHGPSKYEGTGIGLSICRKIVGQHGGTIELESELGQGTTFLFTLPGAPLDGKPDFD